MAQQDDGTFAAGGIAGVDASGSTAPGEEDDTGSVLPGTEQYMRMQKQKPLGWREGDRRRKPDDIAVSGVPRSVGQTAMADALPSEPRRNSSPLSGRMSPGQPIRPISPGRRVSPATSQIFERDVQESTVIPEMSPAIPSHMQTEDHIPPVLEASSIAITDNKLNPDDVEIVTHAAHMPAAATVPHGAFSESPPTVPQSSLSELTVPQESEDTASSYGAVDNSDPRRLSFISFADVVHAEQSQSETIKDPLHNASPNVAPFRDGRSPSPARSPLVSLSPPTVASPLSRAVESSPVRGGATSVASTQGTQHGELTIETMRQALEKTGSNDLTAQGVQPLSASSDNDGAAPRSFR